MLAIFMPKNKHIAIKQQKLHGEYGGKATLFF
jgi:hypothetical protein